MTGNSLSLSKREWVLKKSTAGKFTYIRHFQGIAINAIKFEKREVILKVTISLS